MQNYEKVDSKGGGKVAAKMGKPGRSVASHWLVDHNSQASVHFTSMAFRSTQPVRRFKVHPAWHILGGFFVALWLFLMFSMFLPSSMDDSVPSLNKLSRGVTIPKDDSWMSAFHKGKKLGYIHTLVRMKGDGVELTQNSRLRISVAGLTQSLDSELAVLLDKNRYLKSLFFSMTAGPIALSFSGIMGPGGLEIDLEAAGKRSRRLVSMDEPPVLDVTIPFVLAQQNLYPGARFEVRVFDPRSMHNTTSFIEVLGSEALSMDGKLVAVTHVRRTSSQTKLDSWFDKTGRIVKEEANGGLLLLRQGEDQAKSRQKPSAYGSGVYVDDDSRDWLRMIAPHTVGPGR